MTSCKVVISKPALPPPPSPLTLFGWGSSHVQQPPAMGDLRRQRLAVLQKGASLFQVKMLHVVSSARDHERYQQAIRTCSATLHLFIPSGPLVIMTRVWRRGWTDASCIWRRYKRLSVVWTSMAEQARAQSHGEPEVMRPCPAVWGHARSRPDTEHRRPRCLRHCPPHRSCVPPLLGSPSPSPVARGRRCRKVTRGTHTCQPPPPAPLLGRCRPLGRVG